MNFAKLVDYAKAPTRKHAHDAGLDVYSAQELIIPAHSVGIVGTGITVEVPKNCVCFVWPKSKSDYLIGAGVIDSQYQGEVFVKVVNVSGYPLGIGKGQAIAQLVVVPVIVPEIVEFTSSDELHKDVSDRGATGGVVTQYSQATFITNEEVDEWLKPDLT